VEEKPEKTTPTSITHHSYKNTINQKHRITCDAIYLNPRPKQTHRQLLNLYFK